MHRYLVGKSSRRPLVPDSKRLVAGIYLTHSESICDILCDGGASLTTTKGNDWRRRLFGFTWIERLKVIRVLITAVETTLPPY